MENTEIVKSESQFPKYFAATNSEQMARAQGGLTIWVENRIHQSKHDVLELDRAVNHARSNKWNVKALERQLNKAVKLQAYYEKMGAALNAGFVLVPAFPIDVFAIRTAREAPKAKVNITTNEYSSNEAIHSEAPPCGEGEYKASEAVRTQTYSHNQVVKKDAITGKILEEKTYYRFENEEFQDVTFPMIACKPEVMSATAQAMMLKIFDEIGVSHDNAGQSSRAFIKGDPLIIGSILGPKTGYKQKKCHFLISWHIDVADL